MSQQKDSSGVAVTFRVVVATLLYFVGGAVALHFIPDDWLSGVERNLGLLRTIAASFVILFGLFRLLVDRLKGVPVSDLLTWFFVIFSGAVLIRDSWVLVGFMALIFIVFLLVDFDPTPKKSEAEMPSVVQPPVDQHPVAVRPVSQYQPGQQPEPHNPIYPLS